MSYSDLRKKYGIGTSSSASESNTANTSSGGSGGYAALLKKHGISYDVDDNFINTFIADANSFLSVGQGNASSSYESKKNAWKDLDSRSTKVRGWLYTNKNQLDEETFGSMSSFLDNLKTAGSILNSFKDEEDYNFWDTHSTVEKRQEWYNDLQAKVDDLGSVYDDYFTIDLQYQEYMANPGAYTQAEAQEILSKYEKHKAYKQKYSSADALKREIEAAEAEMRNYERGNFNENGRYYGTKVVDDYYKVTQNPDFAVDSANRSHKNPTRDELTEYDALTDSSTWYYDANNILRDAYGNEIVKDSTGHLVNPKAKDYAVTDRLGIFLSATERDLEEYAGTIVSGTWGNIIGEGIDGSWNKLDKDEIAIYYYLLNNSGQETADKYLADMKTELNRRQTLEEIDQWHTSYDDANLLEKIALNAATVPAKFLSNIAGPITNAVDTLQGRDINPYSFANSGMHFSQTVRGDTAEDLDKSNFKIPVIDFTLGDIYQTGMSRLDSALATGVFGGGGTVFLGMGAAQDEAYRLYQQGASAEQITLDALAAGVAEAAWEYISFGKLEELKSAKNPGQWVKNILIQGWNEAFEEAGTEVTNILTNALIMGSQSDLAALYRENEESAFRTFVDLLKQTTHAAFGGFIGGAMAGGVQGGKSYIGTQVQYANAGEKITDSVGGVDALKNLANEVAGVSDAKMQKSLNKQVASVEKKATNRKVGKLYDTLGQAYNAQNKADIVTILEMNKFGSEQANAIADAIVAFASGNLTEQQAEILETYKDNDHVKGVMDSYDFDERSSIGKRNLAMHQFAYGVNLSAEAKKYADKVFTPEGKYAVSSDGEAKALVTEEVEGKTITKDTGEVINIKGIKEIRKGKMLLDIGDGKTIDAKNVAYANKNDALIYEAIANLGDNIDADTANRLISKFDGGNAMVFARGITQAYTYGFYGLDRSEMKGKHTLSAELTEAQRNFAYGLGEKYRPVKDAKAKAEAKVAKAPGEKGVYYRDKDGKATDIRTYLNETKIGLKDVQKTAIEVMEKMSEMLGVRFNVFESWVENGKRYYLDENGAVTEGNPNGFYDTLTGEIYIDLNAGQDYQGTMLFTVAHELTHFMRQWSPEQFTKIAKIVFQHGGMKGSVAKLAAIKQQKAKAKGKPISYDTAVEEVVADGMETILKDGKVLEFMEDVKKTDHEAWTKLKEWFKKLADFLKELVSAYNPHSAQTVEGAKVADFAEDLLNQIKQLYAEGAVAAGESYQMAIGKVKVSNDITMKEDVIDSSNIGIAKETKTGVKMQERTEFEAQPKQVFRVSTANGKAESKMLGTNKSVKELRDANFKENGFSDEEIAKVNGFIKEMADNMTKYRLKYKFVGLQNIYDAKIILDPMNGKIVLSAMVNNSDYSVNFDFTNICKKRVALQEVLETLAREKGKVTDGKVTEVNLSPANIKHINDILASYGVETACLCCFVESKRYNIQNYYQEKVVDVWNMLVDEVAPDAGHFNFADSDVDTSKVPDSEFAELEKQMKDWSNKTGKAKDVEQKMREFLADAPAARKKLRFSDLVTANGRTNLHKLYPEIESLILSKLGQSAPKSVEAFTPYNGEIDLLEGTNNSDIVKYLYSIAGVRSQSFSDFMIAHVFDVLQKTASMSARKMPAHVYTKEIARAILFGMTGEKHNLSVLHNVDPDVDSWSAGLSKDGEYNFSDYEAYKKGYSEFIQSIGWKDAVKLQNTEGYSKDCGIIGVGFSYNHMLKLHNDPEVRQVIGYHTSQMPVEVKPLTHLDKAADYTAVQNTKAFVGFAKPNYAIPEGVPSYATPPQDVTYKGSKTKKVSDTFDIVGTFNRLAKGKTGDARTAAAKETLRQLLEYANDHGYCIVTASGEAGHGEFQLYEDVQKTENPYLTADHYIEYCIERGMLPQFFEFSMNPNYYKDVFDFNVFDRLSYNPETGLHEDSDGRKAYAPQTAVHMLNEDGSLAFPENFFDIVDKQMSNYNSYMQDVDSKMPSIMDEVRAVTNSTSKLSDRDTRKVLYQDRINELTEEDVYKLIENSNHGEYALDTFIPVRRDTPPLLVELSKKEGLPPVKNLPIIMNVEHIQQCMDEEVAATDRKRGHALTAGNIIEIIKGLDNPRYVFFQKDNKRYCEVVEYAVGNKGKKAMAIVTYTGNKNQDLMNGFPGREYNILVTAYPPDAKYWKDYQKSSNNVLIYDKTKDAPQGSYGSHVPSLLSGSPFATKVTQPDTEVKSKVDRDSLTPDQQKHFDYNQKQKTVGSALKTLKGSSIKRSTKFGVGKEIGGEIYFHKDYAEDILPDEVLSQALQLLEEEQPGFEYNCLKYNPKTGVVAFQEAPDFDSAREPVVGDYVSVNTNTGVVKTGHSNYIWHHKWNWVKNDYSGFDVAESWNWSKQWLSTLTEVSDGNGIERWNTQLDKFGLPHEGAMFSDREQEFDSKDTSVKILPATFTKFGLKATDRVLDWGGGQYDIAKKAVEQGYPGIKFEVVDAFNRTKSHNDRILAEYKENPATVLTINNVLNVIKETEIIEDVIRESKEYLAADGVCYIKIYEGNETDGKTGNGKVTSSGWQNNQPAEWYKPFAEKYYKYVERVGDILVCSDNPIDKKALPKVSKETAGVMRGKVKEIAKAEPSMRASLYSDRDNAPTFYSQMAKVVDGMKQEKFGKKWGTKVGKTTLDNGTEVWSMAITDSMKESVLTEGQALYQDRDDDSVSNRSLLANAFEGLAQNDIERNKIQEYKGKIALINDEERKLRELNEQIKELSFSKGPRDAKKIKSLQFEANQAANRINTYDKQLLRLEASKPLQDILAREKKQAYKKAEQKGKEALATYKEKTAKTQRELLNRWQESRKKGIESREKTAMRHKIQSVVGELNQLLLSNDKKRHVPDSLKKAVADALALVNMDTVGAEERAAKYAALIAKESDPDKIDAYTATMENILRQGEKMGQRLKDLRDAYDEIQNSDDPDIANAYDPVIAGSLKELAGSIGNTSLRDMTIEQLQDVYDMYRMVLTRVRDANKTFIKGRTETISSLASRVVGEVKKVGGEHKYRAAILDFVKKFGWDNLKPVYAFEHLGSGTLTDVFNSVRAGEDVWAVDVSEARAYYLDKYKKHGYDSWDFKKKYRFKSASELDFELTLEQILSLYAYSKREQAHDHLRLGGFVFDSNIETYKEEGSKLLKYKVNTADAHQITPEILANIIGTLSEEQKSFVDEMQEYLSTVMGAKGNEVTMQMYGVKLFKEKFYFPLKSAKQFMFEQNEVSGEVRIKNSGFTNKVVAKANNPVILNNFMDVWAGHVNDMSMYHAFVLPLEDFNRIFNYNSPKQEGQPPVSVKGTIQNAYGPSAVGYVRQLITDLNGGARSDSTTGIINKMIGLFKKGSVFASLSVVVQQPSAIARAAALVDTKYFIGPKVDPKRHKELWDEVKKYAPVAIIKEMGYFDTNMGKSTQDFIKGREYSGFEDKMKALVVDSDYRDEVLSKAPALADELAWCGIWEAVKRETKAKNPGMDVKSEAFLKKAGERFTEVITKTQVYDSILSRSGMMRSKDTGMKMATAFMGEPTTSINMVADALIQGVRGDWRKARRQIGSVVAAGILNAILVSFVFAGRDDDEDETYWEKYIGTLSGEILDSLNPAGYIPFIKDIMSIVQGYDVERSDMAVISDLWKAIENLSNDKVSAYRKVEGFAGSVAQIFGLPVKNIMRDTRGIYQIIMSFVSGQKTTAAGIGYAVKGAITGKDVADYQQLYEAYLSGDSAQIARVKGRLKDQDAINTAIRKALRENDPRIKEAAIAWNANDLDEYMRIARAIIAEKHFAQDDVVMAIRSEANALAPDDETETQSKAKGLFTAEKFAEAIAQGDQATANAIKVDIIQTAQKNGKTEEEAEESFASSAKSELKESFLAGKISEDKLVDALVSYFDMDESEAELKVESYAWEEQGYEGATSAAVRDYNTFCEAVSVPKDVYLYIRSFANNTENDKDANGKSITYSAMKKVMAEIHAQAGLTPAQKTAIARSLGWAEKNIHKYKLW